jgi:type II secretion system protein H
MPRAGAFTLVELILVMALLCVILALAAPSLSRSFRERDLTQEATRLLALTEYARDEAVSQGVPMSIWIDPATGHFGAQAMPGYEDAGARGKQFTLIEGLHFDLLGSSPGITKQTAPAIGTAAIGGNDVAEYLPDGTLDPSSRTSIRLVDRSNSAIEVEQMKDASGYEIVKDAP